MLLFLKCENPRDQSPTVVLRELAEAALTDGTESPGAVSVFGEFEGPSDDLRALII
jgi:hypothetical protein